LAKRKNGLTESSNSSGGGTGNAFYDKVFSHSIGLSGKPIAL
jgi:hypothetical protein